MKNVKINSNYPFEMISNLSTKNQRIRKSVKTFLIVIFLATSTNYIYAQGLYDYYLSQIRIHYIQGNLKSVEDYVKRGKSKYPDSSIFYLQAADLCSFDKNYRGSITELNLAQKLGTKSNYMFFSRAVAYHNLKILDSAAQDYQTYLSHFPDDKFGLINYGIVEFDRMNYDIAKQKLLPFVEDSSFEFPRKQNILVKIFVNEKDYDSVIWTTTKIIALDSTYHYAYYSRAYAHESLGNDFKACEDYLKVFELGNYSIKEKFDAFGCFELLNMSDPNSPYSYPPPPPEIIIEESIRD